jgi:hypothetical protein
MTRGCDITINVRVERMGINRSMVVQIAEELMIDAMMRVDYPSENADPIYIHMVCTRPNEIKRKELLRNELAKLIGERVQEELLRYFKERDTVMGYHEGAANN